MRVRIVTIPELTDSDIEDWADLRRRAVKPYPFLDPRILVPSARHREGADSMRLLLLDDGTSLLLIMPFVLRRAARSVPLKTISTRDPFLVLESGWRHPLVDASRCEEALRELVVAAKGLGLPGLIDFDSFPMESPLAEALASLAEFIKVPVLERHRFEVAFARRTSLQGDSVAEAALSSAATFTMPHFSSGTRKNHARFGRGLEKAVGSELWVENRGADPAAIDQFFALQAAGWKGDSTRGGAAMSTTGTETWFREVAAAYRAEGDFGLYTLAGRNDTVVYMSATLRIGQTVFGYADAYDERFARYRAGALGRVATVNRALAEPGNQGFDPNLSPSYVESTRLFPDRQKSARLLMSTGGPLSKAVVRGLPAGQRLRSWLRSVRS